MTTLIPKFDLKNGTAAPSNAINRPINQKLSDFISVFDFGATGDGTTDDTVSIQAALDYGTASTKTIYFPDGNYKITAGLTAGPNCGFNCAANAVIQASGNTFDALTLTSGNWNKGYQYIPSITGGKASLVLYGANLANIYIASVGGGDEGIVLRVDNTNKSCADNTINFTSISSVTYSGVLFDYLATTLSGTLMQGNIINGNFIVNCLYGVTFFDTNGGSLGLNIPWDDTQINVFAIDLVNITGSVGIHGQNQLPPTRFYVNCFGYFDGMDAYITGTGNGGTYKLAFVSTPAYAKNQLFGVGNRIFNIASGGGGYIEATQTPVPLTSAVNTISTFNGGNPVLGNRFTASITIPSGGLAAGSTQLGFFYHPLMTNYYPKITVEPFWAAPMVVQYACEDSTGSNGGGPNSQQPYPYQGVVCFLATAAVAAGTYTMFITVHDNGQ